MARAQKTKNISSLPPPRSKFYKTQWAWQGVKLTELMSIFTSKKVWKFLIQVQLTKSNPKITRRQKCIVSCQLGLMQVEFCSQPANSVYASWTPQHNDKLMQRRGTDGQKWNFCSNKSSEFTKRRKIRKRPKTKYVLGISVFFWFSTSVSFF